MGALKTVLVCMMAIWFTTLVGVAASAPLLSAGVARAN